MLKVRPIMNESTIDCPTCGAATGNAHRERDCFEMIQWAAAVPDSESPSVGVDLYEFLHRQIEWSRQTFGPGGRTEGLVDHIRKELDEVLEANLFSDGGAELGEWVDVVILALDGAWRAGNTPLAICAALEAKAEKNRGRRWPDWRTAVPGKAIEHVRDAKP